MAAARVHRAEHAEDHIGGVLQHDQPLAVLEHDHARELAATRGCFFLSRLSSRGRGAKLKAGAHSRHKPALAQARIKGTLEGDMIAVRFTK